GFFITLGVILFFDRAMLAMGNILFLIGIPLILGPQKTIAFFARRQKIKGTIAFGCGIILILMRWALVGFIVEAYGIAVLFGDFLVTIAGYLGVVPVVGPYIQIAVEKLVGGRRNSELPV
ncbi:MAG: Golgi Transport, partial [Stictis urceolatum]|nr:Golgi Transport [Stictis urceolata]